MKDFGKPSQGGMMQYNLHVPMALLRQEHYNLVQSSYEEVLVYANFKGLVLSGLFSIYSVLYLRISSKMPCSQSGYSSSVN